MMHATFGRCRSGSPPTTAASAHPVQVFLVDSLSCCNNLNTGQRLPPKSSHFVAALVVVVVAGVVVVVAVVVVAVVVVHHCGNRNADCTTSTIYIKDPSVSWV